MTDEERKAYWKKYYAEHRAACIEKQKRYRDANREKVNAARRAFNKAHPEKQREYMRKYRQRLKERQLQVDQNEN